MNSEKAKLFPLPKQQQGFETKRTLVGLFKMGALETKEEFVERIWQEWQRHEAKRKK